MPEGVTRSYTIQRGAGGPLAAAAPPAGLARAHGEVMTWPLDGTRPEALARRVVTSLLAELGTGAEQRDDAELAICELVVNARLHAPGPYQLRVRARADAVRFEVADGGSEHASVARRLAAPATAPDLAEHGRGLRIVAALFPGACGARAALIGPGQPGKGVWISVAV
jgi:transposase InsO family protein